MASIFIAQYRWTAGNHDEWEPISHHLSLPGAAKAIADDARRISDNHTPGIVTDEVHAAIVEVVIDEHGFDASHGIHGDNTLPSEARDRVDRVYRIEEVPLLD